MALVPALHFADIGAYIGTLNSLSERKEELKLDLVAAVEQLDSNYTRVTIMPSYISNVAAAVQSITNGENNIVSAITDYHLQVLTEELPSTETTLSGVVTDLFALMGTHGPAQTFQAEGNFHKLYRDRLGRTDTPTAPSGSNTVPDALGD